MAKYIKKLEPKPRHCAKCGNFLQYKKLMEFFNNVTYKDPMCGKCQRLEKKLPIEYYPPYLTVGNVDRYTLLARSKPSAEKIDLNALKIITAK